MARIQWSWLTGGFVLGAAAAAAWRLYDGRSRERIAGMVGMEDPEAARAYGQIAARPQMRLIRRFAARRAIALKSSGKAIDLGCGPGYLAIELARWAPGLRITGVDLSDEMLAQGGANAVQAGMEGRVAFRKGDAGRIPFADGSLDLVVSTLSLHHWDDPVAVLREVARVLRPGGAFMIFDLRRDLPPPLWLLVWFATNCVVPGALRYAGEPMGSRNAAYTPDEAAQIAAAAGLTCWRVAAGPLWLAIEGSSA